MHEHDVVSVGAVHVQVYLSDVRGHTKRPELQFLRETERRTDRQTERETLWVSVFVPWQCKSGVTPTEITELALNRIEGEKASERERERERGRGRERKKGEEERPIKRKRDEPERNKKMMKKGRDRNEVNTNVCER